MFVDPVFNSIPNPVLEVLSGGAAPQRLQDGLYLIRDFSFDMRISREGGNLRLDDDIWNPYADELPADAPAYGVCDSPAQFLSRFGAALQASPESFCVSFTCIEKSSEPAGGGWRWHKWGPYVGEGEPQYEYLHDEPLFERVYCFHIFRKLR